MKIKFTEYAYEKEDFEDLHSIAMVEMSHTGGASLIKKFLSIE